MLVIEAFRFCSCFLTEIPQKNTTSFHPSSNKKAIIKSYLDWAFLIVWDGGRGVGRNPPPPLDFESIKAMTAERKGQIVRPKMFPLRSATSADDDI